MGTYALGGLSNEPVLNRLKIHDNAGSQPFLYRRLPPGCKVTADVRSIDFGLERRKLS